ncbi:MAG: hypothetical protein IJV56_05760 [Neisseriaceae bacterium]|nr:hypothetical protein [Neisseriaceae bacterium]
MISSRFATVIANSYQNYPSLFRLAVLTVCGSPSFILLKFNDYIMQNEIDECI